jgi:hypothetical protein
MAILQGNLFLSRENYQGITLAYSCNALSNWSEFVSLAVLIYSYNPPFNWGKYQICSLRLLSIQFVSFSEYINYFSKLARFFGKNASQDATKLYIQKSDLPYLTATENNTAESLFVALLLKVLLDESNSLSSPVFVYHWGTYFSENKVFHTYIINLFVLVVYVNYEAQNLETAIIPDTFN